MTSRRRTTVLAVLVGLLAAAVIASAAVYVLMLRPVGRLDQARTDGLAAATSRAQELFSYTPAGLDAELARARAGVSAEFAAEFGRLQSRLIEPAVRAGLTTQATVVRAAVVRAEPEQVVALVFLDQRATKQGSPPTVTPSRLEITVRRIGGQWLVTGLRNL